MTEPFLLGPASLSTALSISVEFRGWTTEDTFTVGRRWDARGVYSLNLGV